MQYLLWNRHLAILGQLLSYRSTTVYHNPFVGSLTGVMNAIGSVSPIISTPIAGAVLQNDVSFNVACIMIAFKWTSFLPLPHLRNGLNLCLGQQTGVLSKVSS